MSEIDSDGVLTKRGSLTFGVQGVSAAFACAASHPSNPWGVSPWNTTPLGYMSPTHIPFSKPWTLRAGDGVRLRYLILAYTGDPAGGEVDEVYRSYISN